MKQKLTLLLTAFLLLTGMNLWGQFRTEVVAYDLIPIEGGSNGYATESEIEIDGITWNITGNTTLIPWRIGGKNLTNVDRNVFSESALVDNISRIEVEHGTASNIVVNSMTLIVASDADFSNPVSTLVGEFAANTTTTFNRPADTDWTNMYYKITYNVTVEGTSNKFLQFVGATFYKDEGGGQQETVAMPTFNPVSGSYFDPQSVTIACATEGATIRYTTDGTDPTESSEVYSSALTISETTTVKAKGFKAGYTASNIATAVYTFPELITIMEAHNLAINEYGLVQGVVTFIDNRNVYAQDATGGICLFLNANTVPSDLAIGDLVKAYGKRANYNGLIELSGINGNSSAFTILSSGNTLPLAVKTIAEINEGGADALQCTRVKIEEATIGTINTSGNTPLTQGENSTNIYKVPELTGIEEGDVVDVTGVIGYFNAAQIRVATAADVVLSETPVIPDPELTVSVTELNDFRYTYGEGPSTAKTFTISGTNLVDDVTLTAPQHYELSISPENGYFDTDELSPVNGTLDETTVYVRLKAGLEVGAYSGNLTIVSGDLSHIVALNGMVDEIPVVTMTIAEARALENGQMAQVIGTVVFIDGRNVYVQDETAGIDLYLNNNTVPAGLAIGDEVQAYGSRAVYKGLVELSGINGNNADEFTVLSHNNTLPLAVKTIAEINSDFNGVNLLQSTRVKIENAIVSAINYSNNTVIQQGENTLNIYRLPNVEGLAEGDMITVTGVIGCYNTPQLRVVNASDVEIIQNSNLTVNPSSLTGFTYEYEAGGPSEIQTFVVGGDQLTNNVSVFPSESFEISTLPVFHPENPGLIIVPSGHFTDITISVRMKAGLEVGTYSEQIAVVSEGAETVYVNVTGVVTGDAPTPPTPPTPGEGNYVRISDLSDLANGDYVIIAARFDGNAADYYAMSNTSSGKPTGVLFTSATSGNDEVLPASIVDEEGSYYWIVGVTNNGYTFTNAAGELIGYGASGTDFVTGGEKTEWNISLETSGESAMVPNYTGFYITNATTTGRGFALNNSHNYGAYAVSNNNSASYNFYLDLFVKTEGGVSPTPTVATPTFTPEAGTYYEAQTVSITCPTQGSTIYYSTVSENGPWTQYTGPITIEETTTIWAYATMDGYNDSPVAMAIYTIQLGVVTIFNQDWEGEMNGWTFVDVEGEMSWTIAQYSGNHYAYANGYNHGANIDWCISPAFNLDAIGNPVLTFRTAKNYTGPNLEVFFSNNYDGNNPNAATWTPLTCNLSPGSWTWTESGEISLSGFSGSNCYIGFKYTCTETEAAGWEVDDIMLVGQTSASVVTVTPLALNGFTYIEGNGPSDYLSFTVSGFNLSDNITVTPSTNYEISLTPDSGYTSNDIPLVPVGGNVEDTPIYVHLKAGLAVGNYNENITVSCDNVEDILVACSGTVTAQPVPGDDYVRISDVSELTAGNKVILASRYNETTDAYLAIENTLTSGKLPTTPFTSEMSGYDEIIPASILANEDSYYWTVGITADGYTFTNANGDMIGYGNSGTNLVMGGEKTDWTVELGISDTASLVPDYIGFKIINVVTDTRGLALRVTETESVVKAYSTSNINNGSAGEYNFFLDIFMQGESGSCTVAAPTFNPEGGTYYEGQVVTINCATPGATIYFSTGSEPGTWNLYTGPITVDTNMTIWAYAVKEGCNDSPVVSAEYIIQDDLIIIFNQDWEEDWHGWTEVLEYGDSLWRIASYQGNHYAYANGYNHPATADWLISPAFDLDSYSDVVLSFLTAKNYIGPELEVYFSNDFDGQNLNATWVQLDCELSQGGWNWTPSGDISLDDFSGMNCHIGFKYQCTDDEAAGWEVDDILLVSGGGATPVATLMATPNSINGLNYVVGNGPSDSLSYVLTGANLEGEGYITVTVTGEFEILNDDGTYSNNPFDLHYSNGVIDDQPVIITVHLKGDLPVGTYLGEINHVGGGASAVVSLSGNVYSDNEPNITAAMPLYIQGNNGTNTDRVPVAIQVTLFNLEPNTTYRYTNQFVDGNDGPETAGAGNVIYVNNEGFNRTTSPSLATDGGYGEFTTSANGSQILWFMNEPTANARFTPGNHVYLRIRLNDGQDGTEVAHTFTTTDYATVLNFGTENDEYSGSAFYVKSNEAPMSFAMLMSHANDYRPLYSTSIETTGVDYGNINQYADFYKELVAGKDGWFGGILPNVNPEGVNYIVIWDLYSYTQSEYFSENGEWYPEANTINPNAGLDEPIFIDLTYEGVDDNVAANVNVWNADHEFVIENGDDAHYSMTVYNVLGQPMMMKQINAGSTERISHSLASGVYIISLQNNQNKVSVKVIVR
ncbi:MAG: chitobiase/beta-hexosaminidase C-terminal domain-containing protein [Bacteroidales bacterium]|nr:chitobiase/beta-hexosaminidase C-terminal domain-containing protein [Bacteroidales bacterium]